MVAMLGRGVCCASCVKVIKVNRWWQLLCYTKNYRATVLLATEAGAWSWGIPHPSLAGEGCSWLEPAPVPGWWAGVGTQALVILGSHLASPQCVLLLFSATESVCEGKLCHKAREGNAEAFLVLFQPTQICVSHIQPPVSWAGQHRDICILLGGKNVME